MPITDTGAGICDCGYRFRYQDIYNGVVLFTQCMDKWDNVLECCPCCGRDFGNGGYRIKSDKPAFSVLAGYEPSREAKT